MEWLIANWQEVLFIITSVVTVASVAAKLTPTKVDDNLVGNLIKLLDVIGLNNPPTETKKKM